MIKTHQRYFKPYSLKRDGGTGGYYPLVAGPLKERPPVEPPYTFLAGLLGWPGGYFTAGPFTMRPPAAVLHVEYLVLGHIHQGEFTLQFIF